MAGVSLKTVTNVVHERPYVSMTTRQRVLAAIAELDYRPSLAGRQLRGVRSNISTLAVPRIDEPYLGALAHAMIAAATPRGYTVLIDETGGRPDHEREAVEGYPGHGIDGVIFCPLAVDPEYLAAVSQHTPLVLLGEQLTSSPADYVAIDNEGSARGGRPPPAGQRPTTDRLPRRSAPAAHRRRRPPPARLRARADRLRHHGPDDLAGPCRALHPGGGRGARREMLQRCPARRLGLRQRSARHRRHARAESSSASGSRRHRRRRLGRHRRRRVRPPTLSTVAPDLSFLAASTIEALIRRIEGDRSPGRTVLVPHHLIIRESSGARSQGATMGS